MATAEQGWEAWTSPSLTTGWLCDIGHTIAPHLCLFISCDCSRSTIL